MISFHLGKGFNIGTNVLECYSEMKIKLQIIIFEMADIIVLYPNKNRLFILQ